MAKENKTPSIYDKDWQEKKELGKVEKTFTYKGTDGNQCHVTATATIHPGSTFEKLEEDSMTTEKNGMKQMDTKKHARSIMKTVYGIDGTGLQAILDNKGADLFNQMRTFAFSLSGLTMSDEDVEKEKN
jgi:hypothetical protein